MRQGAIRLALMCALAGCGLDVQGGGNSSTEPSVETIDVPGDDADLRPHAGVFESAPTPAPAVWKSHARQSAAARDSR